jgi:hypothetical protein
MLRKCYLMQFYFFIQKLRCYICSTKNIKQLINAEGGLKLQKQVGKRFLKLGATTQVVIPTKNTKYLQLQKLNAKGFDEAQMLAVVEFLNS